MVKIDRLNVIQTKREKDHDELADEMNQSAHDTEGQIHCPACMRRMQKRSKQLGQSTFGVDRCESCQLIWLDNGELAKLQIIYEFSEQGREAQRFKDRLNNMTPQEKNELKERISKLPKENVATDVVAGMMDLPNRTPWSPRETTGWFEILDWFY